MTVSIDHIENRESAASVRDKLNKVIDAANVIREFPNLSDCPEQCPPGPSGKDGEKGDPGEYRGISVLGVKESYGDLLNTPGNSGDAWVVENSDGNLELYMWAALSSAGTNGWKNYGPINDTNYRNVPNCIFVAPDGNDDLDGRTFGKALRTLDIAAIAAKELGGKVTVFVYPGDYEIEGNIEWPDLCTVFGIAGARKTTVKPKSDEDLPEGEISYKNRNAFLLGDGGYVEGFSFEGFEVYSNSQQKTPFDDPTGGFAIAFRPNALINRVPYAHNITVYKRFPPRSLISSPMDRQNGNPLVGPGGGVAIADGSILSGYSAFPNIMTWGATPSSPNGIGYLAKKGALLNPVNAVALWAHKHYMVQEGAQMVMSSCSSQFGDYSLWSEGYTYSPKIYDIDVTLLYPSQSLALSISNNTEEIINNLWNDKISETVNSPCGCICNASEYEAFMRRDISYALRALTFSAQSGDPRPVQQFIRGLFNWDGSFVAQMDSECYNTWASWFNYLAVLIKSYLNSAQQGEAKIIDELCKGIAESILMAKDPTNKKIERSLITAINHQWTYPLAGVTKDSVPSRFKNNGYSYNIKRSIVQKDGGRVRYSGQDDEGNAVFVGGLEIEARSGELRGPPFDAAVRKRAIRVAFARSFF
jgi:hypothetical protein